MTKKSQKSITKRMENAWFSLNLKSQKSLFKTCAHFLNIFFTNFPRFNTYFFAFNFFYKISKNSFFFIFILCFCSLFIERIDTTFFYDVRFLTVSVLLLYFSDFSHPLFTHTFTILCNSSILFIDWERHSPVPNVLSRSREWGNAKNTNERETGEKNAKTKWAKHMEGEECEKMLCWLGLDLILVRLTLTVFWNLIFLNYNNYKIFFIAFCLYWFIKNIFIENKKKID